MTVAVGVEQLRLKFPGEPDILFQGLTLQIPKGQKALIVGPSGSGKSTLLQVLSGLIPQAVEVPLKYGRIQRPASWGFVFQDPDTQFCMSRVDEELAFVLENRQVPRRDMEPRMREALALVGLSPDLLNAPIRTLSQGMKQRLALASVLLLEPETVFLDEPSALLDPEGTEQIWTSVKQALKDRTVILVEHKIDAIVDWIDRIIMLDEQGRLVADGEPDAVFRQHKASFERYGIWYPGVWDDYAASARRRPVSGSPGPSRNGPEPSRAGRKPSVLPPAFLTHSPQAAPGRAPDSRDGTSLGETAAGAAPPSRTGPDGRPLLELEQFEAFRGNACKLRIDRAAVAEGAWVAVTGENGAGKSTLLLALAQLVPTAGTYVLRGRTIPEIPNKRRVPEGIALVFQNPEMQFVADSLFDELAVSLASPDKSREELADDVRRLLGMFHLPDDPGRHPYHLSWGQKRRLSVATALASRASVLLLDEPTFGQDARNAFAILECLEALRADGKTVIMVTHDRRAVDHFATEEWVLQQGRLKEVRQIRRT